MEELEKFINNCYIEKDKEYIFVYRLVKRYGSFGLLCFEAQIKPNDLFVYEDFPTSEEIDRNGYDFLKSFIPELDETCGAQLISEEEFNKISRKISSLYDIQEALGNQIKSFIEENGLE